VALTEVTQILGRLERGDRAAAEQLLPLIYDELRKLASARLAYEPPGQTLQATALVHEAWLRLVPEGGESSGHEARWDGRSHFFAAAAEAMRRILVDHALGESCSNAAGSAAAWPLCGLTT
jgi:RNA polymerase sigma factor (TIGR02999 family)